MKITFIGLGIMGSRMAFNLLQAGHELTVYNRTSSASEKLIAKGAIGGTSAQEAVKDADLVISMLSEPEAVSKVFMSENGVLPHIKANAIWIDCSTVSPSFSVVCRNAAKKHQIAFLDAPVAGSKPQAASGELVFFVGGDSAVLKSVENVLMDMGKKSIHIGRTGQGAAFKMVVNMMLAQSMFTFAEAMHFGKSMGIDTTLLFHTVPGLPVSAPFTQIKAPNIKADNFESQFPLRWMAKDLKLCIQTAKELNHELVLTPEVKNRFDEAVASEFGQLDFSAIYKLLA